MSRTIAYLRVSTIDQNLEKNKADILHLANEKNFGKVEFVEEKVSGKVSWRKRKIALVLEELKKRGYYFVERVFKAWQKPVRMYGDHFHSSREGNKDLYR